MKINLKNFFIFILSILFFPIIAQLTVVHISATVTDDNQSLSALRLKNRIWQSKVWTEVDSDQWSLTCDSIK